MMSFIESSAGRIVDRIQSVGASFDPEVLSLPGGSVIALALWAYGGVKLSVRAAAERAARRGRGRGTPPVPAVCCGCK
jgi:hypothetical protein